MQRHCIGRAVLHVRSLRHRKAHNMTDQILHHHLGKPAFQLHCNSRTEEVMTASCECESSIMTPLRWSQMHWGKRHSMLTNRKNHGALMKWCLSVSITMQGRSFSQNQQAWLKATAIGSALERCRSLVTHLNSGRKSSWRLRALDRACMCSCSLTKHLSGDGKLAILAVSAQSSAQSDISSWISVSRKCFEAVQWPTVPSMVAGQRGL